MKKYNVICEKCQEVLGSIEYDYAEKNPNASSVWEEQMVNRHICQSELSTEASLREEWAKEDVLSWIVEFDNSEKWKQIYRFEYETVDEFIAQNQVAKVSVAEMNVEDYSLRLERFNEGEYYDW